MLLSTRGRRKERALTEAEAYARCYGYSRALLPVRIPAETDRPEPVRAAFLPPLAEPATGS